MRTNAFVTGCARRQSIKRKHLTCVRAKSRRNLLIVERLEDRCLMAADLLVGASQGPNDIPLLSDSSSATLAQASLPLSSLPQLHSNPSANAKLFLDFDGHFESYWSDWTNVTTPAFDLDGDPSTFSAGEL